ncbi:MAG: M55 family metallopeptidase [Anaerovoracaceae bacterium]|jgi:D-amino peptidase
MRILISLDAEGITGIHKLMQVLPEGKDYGLLCKMMAHDVNAAVRGAVAAGADEAIVNDCHSHGDNLLITDLDPRAILYSGFHKPLWMAGGSERDVDALMLIGYHSRKGAKGLVSHTIYYNAIWEAAVNGVPFGEGDFVAHAAGYLGVPTILVTGDDCVTAYAKEHMPGVHTVAVKETVNNCAALLYHPDKTEVMIESEAEKAVRDIPNIAPLKLDGPLTLEITFATYTQATLACRIDGFRISDERDNKVIYQSDDYMELYEAFTDAINMAGTYNDMH